MKSVGHRETTKFAVDILSEVRPLTQFVNEVITNKDYLGECTSQTDHLKDLEFVDVEGGLFEGGRDNPHLTPEPWTEDDIAHYSDSITDMDLTAFNHFIDIRKGAGSFDDFDGYSYNHGSGLVGEQQLIEELAPGTDWEALGVKVSGMKVDEGVNYWYNDEYIHAPCHQWYWGCSPSVERYSYFRDKGVYSTKNAELAARFPLADSTGETGKGIPYGVFMPVDNLGRYWFDCYFRNRELKSLANVLHAIHDASIPHHAAGCLGNWHSEYEINHNANVNDFFTDTIFKDNVKNLITQWNRTDTNPPASLSAENYSLIPAKNWRIDHLVTWVALNAYNDYKNIYDNFSGANELAINFNSVRRLTELAAAMSVLLFIKAEEALDSYRFICNKKSLEIHIPSCIWVTKMKESNKVEFISIDAAINQGYNGCYDCRWNYDTDHLSWNR